jgi:hypothetical protein
MNTACPLCHTAAPTLTIDELRDGGAWQCTVCMQRWTTLRLETAAAYARYVESRK